MNPATPKTEPPSTRLQKAVFGAALMKTTTLIAFTIALLFTGTQPLLAADSLFDAAQAGKLEAVKELLEKGADAKQIHPIGVPAIHFAVGSGSTQMVALFLERGASVEAKDKQGFSPFARAILWINSFRLRSICLKRVPT